ncbi:hypothetical protein BAY60_28290 [Prauserella muralis]|uniref:Alpha/beta hydrolase n=1 Tax=Prauserella muralis TaxID=588067 RepID=A0A2V4AMN8_9PSEU|nr:hypothetical protein BAY60_28290 [Prauserella muralis]
MLACTAALAPNAAAAAGSGPTGPVSVRGTHPGGATYAIEVPRHWNGTVLTFSPGYGQGAGTEGRPAELGGNPAARTWLLDNGYALAGTRPFGDGWAVEETLRAVPQTMATFRRIAGEPEVTLAWGASMGGAVTAGLAESRPDVVDGALPYCASVAGPVAMLNQSLDAAFAFRTLLAPGEPSVRLTGFASAAEETRTTTTARRILDSAQRTAEGRARIALAAAFAQVSTWSVPGTAEPSRHDWAGQQAQQYAAFMPTVFSPRYPLEQRAGGNFSWNTGVDYTVQLRHSGRLRQVRARYEHAGLDLDADLRRLDRAPRIAASGEPVAYLERNVTPTGRLGVPVLTVHERGDNYPTVTQARAYADAVQRAGDRRLLRQAFVDRPGHCAYTPAELVSALLTLEDRVRTGTWKHPTAVSLNRLAARLASRNPELGTAMFVPLRPHEFLRPHSPALTGDRQQSSR